MYALALSKCAIASLWSPSCASSSPARKWSPATRKAASAAARAPSSQCTRARCLVERLGALVRGGGAPEAALLVVEVAGAQRIAGEERQQGRTSGHLGALRSSDGHGYSARSATRRFCRRKSTPRSAAPP